MWYRVPTYTPCGYVFEWGRRIIPSDVAWIQIGVTTRREVVPRLGIPMSEGLDWSSLAPESTTTAETEDIDQPRKAIYLYMQAEAYSPSNVRATQRQFWILYDDKGVVQDFGFESSASTQPVAHSVTIR